MSKFSILVKQLYTQKVKSKAFILMTALYVAVIAGFLFWDDIKGLFSDDQVEQVALINETDVDLSSAFISTEDLEWVTHQTLNDVTEAIEDGEYIAAVTLTEENNKLSAKITSYDPLELNTQQQLEGAAYNAGQFYAMGKLNLTEAQADILLNSAPELLSETLNKELVDGKSTDEKQAGMWASYISGFIIYFFVITYLSMITTDIASEKGSRALEMLLVSVRPETHFKAKITGVLLLALTQFLIMFGTLFALVRFTKDGKLWDSFVDVVNDLNISYIVYIVAFLFATIILFLIIGALFGSLVSKVEEASQVMTPAIMITLIGFYIMLTGLGNPDTLLIKVFSYIPFTSGMVMPMRIGATDIGTIGPIISLVILIATIVVLYYLTISLYKRSVLTYASGGIMAKLKSVFKFTT